MVEQAENEQFREAVKMELQKLMAQLGVDRETLLAIAESLPGESALVAEPSVVASPEAQKTEGKLTEISQQLADQLLNDQEPTALNALVQELASQELKGLADEVVDSVRWLGNRITAIRAMPESQLVSAMNEWHRVIDLHLAVDPAALMQSAAGDRDDVIPQLSPLTQALNQRRQLMLSSLAEKGIVRIDAEPGSKRIAGKVEADNTEEPVPTNDPRLEDTIAYVRPGAGGFLYRGYKVIAPTLGVMYEYSEQE